MKHILRLSIEIRGWERRRTNILSQRFIFRAAKKLRAFSAIFLLEVLKASLKESLMSNIF